MPLDAQYAFVLVAAIVSASYFGLLTLWAAPRHVRGLRDEVSRHWFWHVAPLVLSLTALIRMGGPDPFAIFVSQALVIGVYLGVSRGCARLWDKITRRASGTQSRRWRFTLRDGVLAILLAAMALALARHVPPEGDSGHMLPGWRLTVTGLGLGAITCAALQFVAGRLRWYWRIFPALLFF